MTLLIDDQANMVQLERKLDGSLVLHVAVGGVGMYLLSIPLSRSQVLNYNKLGKSFIDELARSIAREPERYRAFHVDSSS